MNKPVISKDFTVEDIHLIREYNREMTRDMTFDDRKAYYERGAAESLERIAKLREQNKVLA